MEQRAKTLMVLGTASGVGKSTLVIGLCRLLRRRGLRVAPFKAQNISDNAHLLPDGRRMARSQAIAAAACGLAPEPDMNPVLLIPHLGGCEAVVDGAAVPRFDRKACREAARRAYDRLAARFEVVVAEGAGSPVELNLRAGDIVNMDFALYAHCPVLLAADIRRGGAFAALYGTLALLAPEERALVKGLIVNDFYGDAASFGEGRRMLEEVCGVPVLGVVPHLELRLEDEDALPGAAALTREKLAALVPEGMRAEDFQAAQFDLLADALEKALDMDALMKILEGGAG